MMRMKNVLCAGIFCLQMVTHCCSYATAATVYVWTNSPINGPGTSWTNAFHNIQSAVNAATNIGDVVIVTNGVYNDGGGIGSQSYATSRVALTIPITVRSVNGPGSTLIVGTQYQSYTSSKDAVRCAYLTNGAILSGFTLSNGWTWSSFESFGREGGGVYALSNAVITNCFIIDCHSSRKGGGVYGGRLYNSKIAECDLTGVYGATVYSSLIESNIYGAESCILSNSIVQGNTSGKEIQGGVGIMGGTAYNCVIRDNTTDRGDGAGAYNATLKNCVITGNSTRWGTGGGVYRGRVEHCTVTRNSAWWCGGVYDAATWNSIVYWNTPSNMFLLISSLNDSGYNCTTEHMADRGGSIYTDPRLISESHLSANSPCVGAGKSNSNAGVDIDGQAWLAPPCIGADQYIAGSMSGEIILSVRTDRLFATTNTPLAFSADIVGAPSSNMWTFGDGTVITNHFLVSHKWDQPGNYNVVLTAYNNSYPMGAATTTSVSIVTGAYYFVNSTNQSPSYPYQSWSSAATQIQHAVDACLVEGGIVFVASGVYSNGSRTFPGSTLPIRLVITNNIRVQSVEGAQSTIIQGGSPIGTGKEMRCAYMDGAASLSGFTLSGGSSFISGNILMERNGGGAMLLNARIENCILTNCSAGYGGGGVYGGIVSNCTFLNNFLWAVDGDGGGVASSEVYGCLLSNNVAYAGGGMADCTASLCSIVNNTAEYGGGARGGTLSNCIIANNLAVFGGGAVFATLNNCILSGNSARTNGGAAHSCIMNNCIMSNNTAIAGGGTYWGGLNNCLVTGNSSVSNGGGTYWSSLSNCTVVGNSANCGGGSYEGQIKNSIIYFNTASSNANYYLGSILYSCTTPLTNASGNISNDPQFVNSSAGDYHLSEESFCINRGSNGFVSIAVDLDGNPRIVSGNVDIGAYELQLKSPTSYWEWAAAITNGLTNINQCATGDGYPNLLKYATGSSPTNSDDLPDLRGGWSNGCFWAGFHRNTNAMDVTIFVEGANAITNNAPWSGLATNKIGSWNSATNMSETGTSTPLSVMVQDTGSASMYTNRFVRLRVTRP